MGVGVGVGAGAGVQAAPVASMPLESQVASQPATPASSIVAPDMSATHRVPSSHDHPPMPKVQTGVVGVGVGVGVGVPQAMPSLSSPLEPQSTSHVIPVGSNPFVQVIPSQHFQPLIPLSAKLKYWQVTGSHMSSPLLLSSPLSLDSPSSESSEHYLP